jgi:hypothetical protein
MARTSRHVAAPIDALKLAKQHQLESLQLRRDFVPWPAREEEPERSERPSGCFAKG